MASVPSITFVCCIESGALEAQTLRLIESIRQFAGPFSRAPIIAVTPRFGPSLARKTLATFDKHHVQYVRNLKRHEYSWFNFYNKPLALNYAEPLITTESIGWLDSDLLFVNEPECLTLTSQEDFLAFPSEHKEMGTTGPGDPYEALWRQTCELTDIPLESLPWTITAQTHERIRLYFNGGLFVYRRNSGFSSEYLRICRTLMDNRNVTRADGFVPGFNEMVSIGLAAFSLHLRWRALPYSHNYPMTPKTHNQWYRVEMLRNARIVHVHNSMWPPFWFTFLECLNEAHPTVARWLKSVGPMKVYAAPHVRLLSRTLREVRKHKERRFLRKSLRIVEDGTK